MRLPSEKEVLIIRPTGKTGFSAFRSSTSPWSPGAPARKLRIPVQDPNASGPGGMQSLQTI